MLTNGYCSAHHLTFFARLPFQMLLVSPRLTGEFRLHLSRMQPVEWRFMLWTSRESKESVNAGQTGFDDYPSGSVETAFAGASCFVPRPFVKRTQEFLPRSFPGHASAVRILGHPECGDRNDCLSW